MRLIFTLLIAAAFQLAIGQVPNSGFRNWTYTSDSFGFSPYIPWDTFSYAGLNNWTTSNQLTGSQSTGGKILATPIQDSTAGKYVVGLKSDSIYISGSLNRGMIAPGFIVNGNFRFDLASILFGSGGLNPATLVGAGTAATQRYDSVGVLVKYNPIPGDSLLLWAVLKKNGAVVASAKIFSTQAFSDYTYVGGPFKYVSCADPDTIVVMIASSNPNFSTLLSGASGIEPGSVLMVDSLILSQGSVHGSPIANSYTAYTFENQAKKINILSGDTDCSGLSLIATIISQPQHGTSTIIANDTLVYTPNAGFNGVDTTYFSISNGYNSSIGSVRVSVFTTSGVNEIAIPSFSIFPNPVKNSIRIHISEMLSSKVQIMDIAGRVVLESNMTGQELLMDISNLSPGWKRRRL